jgi:type I thyroxine 5'-deiodinase
VPALNALFAEYRDRAAFYLVYIQEAHPIDGWQLPSNLKDKVLFANTRTADARTDVANVCAVTLGIQLPALIDDVDDRVERAYTGWPERLYVIGSDGRVAYKGGAGPFGFRPEEAAAALKALFPAPAADVRTPLVPQTR